MACRSLEIVTRGKISCSPLTRMTMGLLCCPSDITAPEDIIRRKGSSRQLPTQFPELDKTKFDYRVYTEEEEIMLLIKIFLKCQ